MKIGPIIQHPSRILREACAPVEDFDADLAQVVRDLRRALELAAKVGRPGFGLSAPQIGIPLRVFVIEHWPDPFVNPVLTREAGGHETRRESCLSLPASQLLPVTRWREVRTRAADLAGRERTRKHRDLDARIVQHELDHLDGILILDRTLEVDRQPRRVS